MPRESGIDLCRELKARADTRAIPIVLLSGSRELASRESAEAGADAYLPKPFKAQDLVAQVEQLLDRQSFR